MSKIERIKAETDGLDVLPELLRAAREGWETMSPEHVGLLKWYGLYAHNTGDGHFMMRVKVIQGKLSAAQVEVMASIAEDFGRGIIDCTTRQCFQIHWIRLENIPEIFERLERVGMTTSGACGDITRNVVGCTVSGLAHDEIVDGYATSEAIHDFFLDNKLYSNLPRKYKVSVTGCAEDCARGLINDIALSAAIQDDGTRGFNLRVGGGLSTQPRFARWVDIFVTPEEAPEVVAAVTSIFRDSDENRKARGKARLKFLVDRIGPEALREEIVSRVGRELRHGVPKAPGQSGEDHVGVLEQADGTHRTVGLIVPVGRLKASQLFELARLARVHGDHEDDALRLTHQQNVLLPWIPEENIDALLAEPLIAELTPTPTLFQRGLQTCTGKEFCGLAKVFTKSRAVEISKFLDEHVRPNGHGDDFRLHFAGCSSSCAQHQIADIGIEGVLKKVDGEFVEAMDIRIGGHLGENPKFGDVVLKKVPHWDLNETLLQIFNLYEQNHDDGETFRGFAGRTEPEWWTNALTPVEEPVNV
jgi:ferredoxin-nitrite reductase